MNKSFGKLEPSRQTEIMKACIDEFAANGYKNASTNQIVKRAGISKGTLFNYFGSKKELYLDIVEHAANMFAEASKNLIQTQSDDLFDRLKERGYRKFQIALRHPDLYAILYEAFVELDEQMQSEAMARMTAHRDQAETGLLEGLDYTKFRPDVDPDKVLGIVQCFLEGYFKRKQTQFKSLGREDTLLKFDDLVSECDDYLNELKKVFYKEGI